MTGVQTCALPIYAGVECSWIDEYAHKTYFLDAGGDSRDEMDSAIFEIGRASCRERV